MVARWLRAIAVTVERCLAARLNTPRTLANPGAVCALAGCPGFRCLRAPRAPVLDLRSPAARR